MGQMNKKRILTIVIIIAAVCVLGSGGILINEFLKNKGQETLQSQTIESAELESGMTETAPQTEVVETQESLTQQETAASKEESVLQPKPYAGYFQENSDMAAWLSIPGMIIDYPVMQTPDDEEYYLRRGFDKKKDTAGCLILDTDSLLDPLATNLIIHGHNMKAGTMFATLMDYEEESFYQEHKDIKLYMKDSERQYEVIAVFYSQVYRKSDEVFKFYKFFQADTEEEFQDFYDNIMEMSLYDTGITAEFGDHFLTLTTCSYHIENGRFVVVAKEVEPGAFYEALE